MARRLNGPLTKGADDEPTLGRLRLETGKFRRSNLLVAENGSPESSFEVFVIGAASGGGGDGRDTGRPEYSSRGQAETS